MKIVFTAAAWADYQSWAADQTFGRINALIADAVRHPSSGLGKPEALRGDLAGWWSRRITAEHRLVYRVSGKGAEQALEIVACRYHYGS